MVKIWRGSKILMFNTWTYHQFHNNKELEDNMVTWFLSLTCLPEKNEMKTRASEIYCLFTR